MKLKFMLAACLGTITAFLPLFAQPPSHKEDAPNKPSPAKKLAYSSEGERVFKQNCARCHDAPQGFPPQISGTVVRHMRMRASLSEQDERELLRFLNP